MQENNMQKIQKKNTKEFEIMDTTMRDGEQTEGVSFSREKPALANMLFDIGVHRIEVASASARGSGEDKKALEEICRMAEERGRLRDVEALGFIDDGESVDWAYSCGCRTINLLAKGSREHCEGQLGKTMDEHIKDILRAIRCAWNKEMDINLYLEDWSRGLKTDLKKKREDDDYKEYVVGMVSALRPCGIKRFMLCDTLGVLHPNEVIGLINYMKNTFGLYNLKFDFHAHNDRGLAVANSMAALYAGADGVHVTVNGIGERAGNCDFFALAANMKDLGMKIIGDKDIVFGRGFELKETGFKNLSRFVEAISGRIVPYNAPIVGDRVYTHVAGVHADGNRKAELYTDMLHPERFGVADSPNYSLGKHAGRESVISHLEEMGFRDIDAETIDILVKRVKDMGERRGKVSREELYFLVSDALRLHKERPFEFISYKTISSLNENGRAYLKFKLNGEVFEKEAASEDGSYDAAMKAIRETFEGKGMSLPALTNYKERIPSSGRTSALVEVRIEWKNGGKTFTTIGSDVDHNIAAARATEDMINLVLMGYK